MLLLPRDHILDPVQTAAARLIVEQQCPPEQRGGRITALCKSVSVTPTVPFVLLVISEFCIVPTEISKLPNMQEIISMTQFS